MRPKWSRSGKLRPDGADWRRRSIDQIDAGQPVLSAISCARRCFFTVIGKWRRPSPWRHWPRSARRGPLTRPIPAMRPGARGFAAIKAVAASAPISRKGEPGSSSRIDLVARQQLAARRHAARPRASGPPSAAAATFSCSSSASARLCASLAQSFRCRLSIRRVRLVMRRSAPARSGSGEFHWCRRRCHRAWRRAETAPPAIPWCNPRRPMPGSLPGCRTAFSDASRIAPAASKRVVRPASQARATA